MVKLDGEDSVCEQGSALTCKVQLALVPGALQVHL